MEKKYLVVNLGSASKKYALYEGGTELFFAHYEKEGSTVVVTEGKSGARIKSVITPQDYEASVKRRSSHRFGVHYCPHRYWRGGFSRRCIGRVFQYDKAH